MSLDPALGALSGLVFSRRTIELDPMGGDRQHHGRFGRQRGDEPRSAEPRLTCPISVDREIQDGRPRQGHGGGQEFRMRVIALGYQIAGADVQKKSGK